MQLCVVGTMDGKNNRCGGGVAEVIYLIIIVKGVVVQ